MSDISGFHIRDAILGPKDAEFIIAAFDSTLPHLESIGSGEQWGSQPFSEKTNFIQETYEWVENSEKYRMTGEGERVRLFIGEVAVAAGSVVDGPLYRTDAEGKQFLAVGVASVRDGWMPSYISSQDHLKSFVDEVKGKGDFSYIEVMVADHRTGSVRKGIGAALAQYIERYARQKGMKAILVDSWAGNERKLNRFYEHLGFRAVGDWVLKRKDKGSWPGTLYFMDVIS